MRTIPFSEQCPNPKFMEQKLRFTEHFQFLFSIKIRNSSSSREAMSKKPGPSLGRIVVADIHDSMSQILMR